MVEMPAYEQYRDEKTGLLWERAFFEFSARAFEELDKPNWCVIAIDIDHFSLLNDWYGRDVGDSLIEMIGKELLVAEKRSGGIAGYLGRDDFALIAPYDNDRIAALYERLSLLIFERVATIGFKPLFGISAGSARISFLDTYDRARMALQRARADYKTDICLYERSMWEESEREYRVLLDFQRGFKEHEFIMYLQPQCRASTKKIVGIEVLVRWLKPDGALVPPDDFIPILEKHGFVTDLDCYVWDHACANIRNWIDAGHTPVPVSLNVSQNDFYAIDVAAHFIHLAEKYDLPPSLIEIEITESAFADSATEVQDAIKRLREAGFMVLMDDFGSGYSSLNRLGSLDVDAIKLDAAFLRMDGEDKRRSIRIVESIINMAKTMAMPIICEGVETKEQLEFLESLGCRFIQGYYFYKPLCVEEFERIASDPDNLDVDGILVKANEQLRIREFLDQNVYSDAMLNNILGPVAYYLYHGNDIDIVRFNEQFYEAVGVPDFHERLSSIQRFVPLDDIDKFYNLFERALNDELNGASDIVGFFRTDGSLSRFSMHMYYLGEGEEGKRFYGSARDVTEMAELQIQLKMLSQRLPMTILFMRRLQGEWRFSIIIHGLAEELGLSHDELHREVNDRSFLNRIAPDDRTNINFAAREALRASADFFATFTFRDGNGNDTRMRLEADRVEEVISEVSYVLKFTVI